MGTADTMTWKITAQGTIEGPGGSPLADVAERLRDIRPCWTALKELPLDPETYQRADRIRGGNIPPIHGEDPGYLRHGKHSSESGPHIKTSATKRLFRIWSTRPFVPRLSETGIVKIMDALMRWFVDGEAHG